MLQDILAGLIFAAICFAGYKFVWVPLTEKAENHTPTGGAGGGGSAPDDDFDDDEENQI